MRNVFPLVVPLAFVVAACGSADGTPESGKKPSSGKPSASESSGSGALVRPALREGYTRFETLTVADLQPGDDITRCQYVMAPVDRDMDIMDITGLQSKFGHHAASFFPHPGRRSRGRSEIRCMGEVTNFYQRRVRYRLDPALSGGGFGRRRPHRDAGRVAARRRGPATRHHDEPPLHQHEPEPVRGEAYIDMKLRRSRRIGRSPPCS
jgi:hypothetical protein